MKTLLTLSLLLLVGPSAQKGPYSLNCPNFSDRLLVVIEYDAGDEGMPWEVERARLTPMRTDAGELLDADTMFTPRIVAPGDADPRSSGFKKLPKNKRLIVWELERPKKSWNKIKRLAGSYELTHGGEVHWIKVPGEGEPDAEPVKWEDKHLSEAGFNLKRGVRKISQLHVQLTGKVFAFDRFTLQDENGQELSSTSSSAEFKSYTEQFNLGSKELKDLTITVHMEDGTQLSIKEIPGASKYRRVRGSKWKKAGITVQTRSANVQEYYAKGTGDFDAYAKYRWIDSKGKKLDIFPESEAAGIGKQFTTACRVPMDLPKGAKLEMGVLVGAKTEWLEYEYLDIPAPR